MRAPAKTIETARRLRRDATDAERRLWRKLSTEPFSGWDFRRQVLIAGHIVDFASHRAKLVIEVDGGQHNMPAGRAADRIRDKAIGGHGYRVVRIWNNDVMTNLEGTLGAIEKALSQHAGETDS